MCQCKDIGCQNDALNGDWNRHSMHLNPLLQIEITVSQPKMRIKCCTDRFGRKLRKKADAVQTLAVQLSNFYLPEDQVVDFELGLYDARRPQPHSQDICL